MRQQDEAAITPEEKRQTLDGVLNSRTLARCGRLKNLLRFIAEAEIEGRGGQLNEYSIGVEALSRPEGYSTLEDSSVRSRTHELRQKLERYYADESPDAAIRIDLPKGSHCPAFSRNHVAKPSLPPSPARRSFDKRLLYALATGFALGALAAGLASATRSGLVPVHGEAEWTPALEAIWQPFLDPRAPLVVSFETRLFFRSGPIDARDYHVNAVGQVESSQALMKIKKLFDLPQLYENRNYTDFGATYAVFLLSRLLASKKPNIALKRSVDVTWNDIQNNDTIFLGKPSTDPQIQHFLANSEFVDEGARIRVVHPHAGEPTAYVEEADASSPSNWSEKYAVISLVPGVVPGKHVLIMATSGSEHPWAVGVYMTSPAAAKELVEHLRLPSGKLPASYQVVIRAHFKGQEPTQVQYVTHRVLPVP
jgi:hypothetical protein